MRTLGVILGSLLLVTAPALAQGGGGTRVTCDQVRCRAGTRCDDTGDHARCVPDPSQKPDTPAQQPQDQKPPANPGGATSRCAAVLCPAGTRCVDDGVRATCVAPDDKASPGKDTPKVKMEKQKPKKRKKPRPPEHIPSPDPPFEGF